MKDLAKIIEGILFLSGDAINKSEIEEKLGITALEVEEAVAYLSDKYSVAGINLVQFEDKIQFCTNPKYVEQISSVLNPIREKAFSQSMLEVVAIVAYEQPCTRLDIERIRGVSSEYAISALLKQNIIEIVGRKDAVGRPFLFGTTENFLKKFNLQKIEDLPEYEVLLSKLKELENVNAQTSVFDVENSEEDDLMNPDFLKGEKNVQRYE